MTARTIAVTAAVAAAAILTPALTLHAKDDPAAIKAAREEVRKKFKDAKKIPSADLSYYIDLTKTDSRWQFSDTTEPTGVNEGKPMFHGTFPSGNATDAAASITLVVARMPHSETKGGSRTTFSVTFKAAGITVPTSDVKGIAEGEYKEFMEVSTEQTKEKCKPPSKKTNGPAEYFACAVGKHKDEDEPQASRKRKDWYLWTQTGATGAFTWKAEFTTSSKFADNDDWLKKIPEIMKNMKELTDPKLK